MSDKTHWLQSPNKNYLGHWDLPESGEMTVTIMSAQWEPVKNPITNKTESKRVIRFKEDIKPMICNQTNAQSILIATGIKFMEDSGGSKIVLFVGQIKDRVTKEDVDCIRVKKVNPTIKPKIDDERFNKALQMVDVGECGLDALDRFDLTDEQKLIVKQKYEK